MILGPNWKDLTWSNLLLKSSNQDGDFDTTVQENLLLKPHLNSALRAEILYFTTQGIIFAAHENRRLLERPSTGEEDLDVEVRHSNSFSFKDKLDLRSFFNFMFFFFFFL